MSGHTIVKANCPCCGDVNLASSQVKLTIIRPLKDRSWYQFTCPHCLDQIVKPAGQHISRLLRYAEVPTRFEQIPGEALEPHAGPALTRDDLLDLALQLACLDEIAGQAAHETTVAEHQQSRGGG